MKKIVTAMGNDILNNDLVIILIMKYGHLDKAYSLEEIAKMTNYSLEEVEKLIQLFLKIYQSPKVGFDNDLTSVFDEEIEVHEEEKTLIKALKQENFVLKKIIRKYKGKWFIKRG